MYACTMYIVCTLCCVLLIDALSVYLTGPSTPPGGGTSTDLSTSVNLYLESGEVKPPWIQVYITTATHMHTVL